MKNKTLQDKLATFGGKELSFLYRECFDSPAGQLVLEDLKNRGFIFAPCESAFDEGARRLVLTIETIKAGEQGGQENG